MKQLARLLERLTSEEQYLFSLADLRGALPEASPGGFKALLSRAEQDGLLMRVCRGIYLYPRVAYPAGLVLFHAAAKLRADAFNYLSLETVLSDAGVISQIPLHWITLMSSGRSHVINHYGVDMGTSGLILQAQSREEILADKLVALALHPNRIKNRDLWDLVWLHQQGVVLPVSLVLRKVTDRREERAGFLQQLQKRQTLLQTDVACRREFLSEIKRFLPPGIISESLEKEEFWTYLVGLVAEACEQVHQPAHAPTQTSTV